ncbi:MAG: plasmid stabilization protein [Leptolyngbya sp. SIO4C5]|nr:plasmid stabilization protein [Leptolyngbya sp. SIO4C5]
MTDITLTHLEPALTERLQQRASANGRTIEAEITAILTIALSPEAPSEGSAPHQSGSNESGLGTAIRQLFAEVGGVDLPEIPREPMREPPTF